MYSHRYVGELLTTNNLEYVIDIRHTNSTAHGLLSTKKQNILQVQKEDQKKRE